MTQRVARLALGSGGSATPFEAARETGAKLSFALEARPTYTGVLEPRDLALAKPLSMTRQGELGLERLHLAAESEEERRAWLAAINGHVARRILVVVPCVLSLQTFRGTPQQLQARSA